MNIPKGELLAHYLDECASAYLYHLLASITKDPARKDIFLKLEQSEQEHQKIFTELMHKEGVTVPQYSPSFNTKLLAFLITHGFPEEVIKLLIQAESHEVRAYGLDSSRRRLPNVLAKDEAQHAMALQSLIAPDSGEPWHHHSSGGILRNVIYGFNDGLTANFGLLMGVIGGSLGHQAIILSGLAGLIANTLSMGSSAYLGAVSEKEVNEHEIAMEKREIELMPEQEEKELSLIYQAKGFSEHVADMIARDIFSRDKDLALKEKVKEELGITDVEIKPFQEGFFTGIATFFGSLIPILPLFFGTTPPYVITSFVISMFFHFAVGAVRSIFTGRSIFRSGIDMFLVGLGVAGLAYVIGYILTGTFMH